MPGVTHEDLPLELWLEIFRLATYTSCTVRRPDPFIPEVAITDIMGYNTPFSSMRTKCSLVLVCRSWRQVATEILYEHIAIRSPRRAKLILATLQGSPPAKAGEDPANDVSNRNHDVYPNYGQWTRSIEVHTHARGGKSVRYLETVFRIMQHCPKVRMFKAFWNWVAPAAFLQAFSRLYSQSLQGLLWNENDVTFGLTCATPGFLSSFQSLRILDIRHISGCDLSSPSPTSPKPLLPYVTELVLSDTMPGFNIASALDLPALHRLSIESIRMHPNQFGRNPDLLPIARRFLNIHGPKITRLEIASFACIDARMFLLPGVCPYLQDLVIHETHPLLHQMSEPHPFLRRIGLRGVATDKLYPDKTSTVTKHLRSFMTDIFPSLEVVRTISYLVDSAVDSLARDIFIWWAERFERYGIDFQDGEGVLWMYTDAAPSGVKDGDNSLCTSTSMKVTSF